MAGSGTTGSHLGEPDLSVMTQTEYAERARMIVMHTDRPVIADADTGFGGPVNIRRTIRLYEHAGVAGCHIEDQVFPKRCGQLNGKDVVDLQVFLERIRAAVEAKTDPDFMVCLMNIYIRHCHLNHNDEIGHRTDRCTQCR